MWCSSRRNRCSPDGTRRAAARGLLIAAVFSAPLGCAHRTRIESNPGGASVYVDERFTCLTPCMYEVGATELAESPLRLERRGYETIRTHLATGVMPSRIVGGIFTLGIVPLFKWPKTYHSLHYFDLRPLDREERLAEVDRQRAAGTITEEERLEMRKGILREP